MGAFGKIPWGNIGMFLFVLYVANTLNVFYTLFYPPLCHKDSVACFSPSFKSDSLYDYYLIIVSDNYRLYKSNIIYSRKDVNLTEGFKDTTLIQIPPRMVKNETLNGHIVLVRSGVDPISNHGKIAGYYSIPLTSHKVPAAAKVNLMKTTKFSDNTSVALHWKPTIISHIMDPELKFDSVETPPEFKSILMRNGMTYKPVVYADQLSLSRKYDHHIEGPEQNLTISFSPVSIGKMRIWLQFEEALRNLQEFGFTHDDVDEIKGIFTDTNMYFLTLTFFVTIFHLLFDFLAFKNDISFWKNRKNTAGLSTRVIIWRCVSQLIIFLYLCEHKTSYVVLGPAGVGMLIEFWKVTKSLKITLDWNVGIVFGQRSEAESETEKHDGEAMWYLQWLLYPLCVGGAIYSLVYMEHRSWYSWVINSLVNGVYLFGFLFMMPQLFVNYKMKSVAHLPWRAFMYKAFNTFIDDIFAFIIVMPTAHRLACFRDDFVFIIFLYQRWLYPVDKTRVNEYGQVFEDEAEVKGEVRGEVKGEVQDDVQGSEGGGEHEVTNEAVKKDQ